MTARIVATTHGHEIWWAKTPGTRRLMRRTGHGVDVFAMPCRTRLGGLEAESLGIVFLEAAASALPVIAGDSGGAPDAVLDGRTGRLVDPVDPAAIAEALRLPLLDPERTTMGAAGRQWVRQTWSWDAFARNLAEVLSPERMPAAAPREE